MFKSYLLFLSVCFASASLGPFHTDNPLNTARSGFCLVQYQQWVYTIGGYGGAIQLGSVERSTLSANGTLDNTFEVLDTALVVPRSSHACIIVYPYIYVFGGSDPNDINSIEQATIQSDGTLSFFTTYSVSLSAALSSPSAIYDDETSSVYIIGGYARAVGIMSAVLRATVDNQGQLSSFVALTSYLNYPRYLHKTIILGRALLVVGGNAQSMEKATINADGTLTAFDDTDTPLLSIRLGLSIGYMDGTLYAVGGTTNKRPYKTVEALQVAPDGSLANGAGFTLVTGAELQTGRLAHEGGVFGGEIVVVGGSGTTGADILSSVEACIISPL